MLDTLTNMIRRWTEYDVWKDKLKRSAGIAIILNNSKILLCHPTKAKWESTYSVPKGEINPDETEIDAAIRETLEEASIIINKDQISNKKDPILIEYTSKSGKKYKNVYIYTVFINDISQIGLDSEIIDKDKLQLREIDWCGFLDKKEASERIFHRMSGLLNLLK